MFERELEGDYLLQVTSEPVGLCSLRLNRAASEKDRQYRPRCADGLFPIRCHRALVPAIEAAAWADQESDRPKIGHQPGAAAFSFSRAAPDPHRFAAQSRAPNRRFGEFRSESRSIEYRSASRRPFVEVGCSDREP